VKKGSALPHGNRQATIATTLAYHPRSEGDGVHGAVRNVACPFFSYLSGQPVDASLRSIRKWSR
jgi:hypothetical protein